jgi:hypothetical protein
VSKYLWLGEITLSAIKFVEAPTQESVILSPLSHRQRAFLPLELAGGIARASRFVWHNSRWTRLLGSHEQTRQPYKRGQ